MAMRQDSSKLSQGSRKASASPARVGKFANMAIETSKHEITRENVDEISETYHVIGHRDAPVA